MSSVYAGNFSQIAGSYADTVAVYSKSETTKTDETSGKKKVSGQTIGNPQLSEKASKYYEQLKKKYSNMNFILVSEDQKENAKANAAGYANSNNMVVLIDEDKIERMASDENYRKQYEGIIANAASGISQLASSLSATGTNVKGFGMQVNDNGTASYFAVLEKSSVAQKERIEKKAAEKAARKLPELSEDAQHSLTVLRRAKEYLDAKPELSAELSAAQRRKRAQLQSKPVYRYVALAIFVFGIVSAAYGLYAVTNHVGNYGIYFALFGFAAIFLFSSYNMLPTARNNNNAIMKRADKAEAAMAEYVKHYPNGAFPVPSCYAHPIVLKQMTDAIEEGRAVTVPEALDAVEARLKSLNADVQVEQEEYDEVVVIKAMFLNHDYQ